MEGFADKLASLAPASRLVSELGLVSDVVELTGEDTRGTPYHVCVANMGSVSQAVTGDGEWQHQDDRGNINGVGVHEDVRVARLLAVTEALERYALCTWNSERLVVAPESGLPSEDVLSPSRWSTSSPEEMARSGSGLRPYDPTLPIRWVRGFSLTNGREQLVPAAAVYMHMQPISGSERFTFAATTGTAAHSDLRQAVIGAILEVSERESIALTWLHQFPLSEIHSEFAPAITPGGRVTRCFDATTDLGIPTVYAVQLSETDESLAQIVAASSALTWESALHKVERELLSLRIALRSAGPLHEEPPLGHVSVTGGARWLGRRSMRREFDFLLRSQAPTQSPTSIPTGLSVDPLSHLLAMLKSKGMDAVAVDVTPDEGWGIGFRVVKVVVPQAIPVSFVPGERSTVCPRLYEVPARMGFAARQPSELNPLPQPFA
ncbi:YcaO-like family protein [Actinomyces bowdenii]|nr:YcaO-like family protein [Actinomyces bowdenii]MBO3724975.1 YcaO-like family protein [Actinomyces bowdenii]